MEENDYTALSAFLAGALIGAGVALLLAPQSGSELRGMLRGYVSRAGEEMRERGQKAWETAVERGKEYLESGREAMKEAGKTAREYIEKGQEAVRQAGGEATGSRG